MKQMSILLMLLMLSGWIQQSGATNCTVYLSSQPLTLNMLCPGATCQLEKSNMRECTNDCPSCNIDDCNKVHNLCNTSSLQRQPSKGPVALGNEQPINCTFIQIPDQAGLSVTCQKGENQLTFKSNTTTACNRDLGINCNPHDPTTCIRTYDLCMEPQPNPCLPLSKTTDITALNQCTETVTVQSSITAVPATIDTSTTAQVSVYPSPTTSLKSEMKEATNVMRVTSSTNTSYPSSTQSPTSKTQAPTMQTISLIIAASATGALVVLLLVVVITGSVCILQIVKKKGRLKRNVMQDRSCTNGDQYTYTETLKFHNPLSEEQQISMSATPPPMTRPNPPKQQGEEVLYAISTVINRRDSEDPKNIQNGPNNILPGGRGNMYHVQDYLTPIKQETKNFQNRPNKELLPDGEIEHQYDLPVCEHQYDKPVIAAKPKKLQGKKGKGVNVGGEQQHRYHILDILVMRDDNNSKKPDQQERKEDHEYNVLEGPVAREGDTKKPDKQEVGNVYHVLEGPMPREGNSNEKFDRQDRGNVYHVLEGLTPTEDNKQKKENVYHVLEGPTPVEVET